MFLHQIFKLFQELQARKTQWAIQIKLLQTIVAVREQDQLAFTDLNDPWYHGWYSGYDRGPYIRIRTPKDKKMIYEIQHEYTYPSVYEPSHETPYYSITIYMPSNLPVMIPPQISLRYHTNINLKRKHPNYLQAVFELSKYGSHKISDETAQTILKLKNIDIMETPDWYLEHADELSRIKHLQQLLLPYTQSNQKK